MTNYITINKYHGNTNIFTFETFDDALASARKRQKKCKTKIYIYKVLEIKEEENYSHTNTITKYITIPVYNVKEEKEIEEIYRIRSIWWK